MHRGFLKVGILLGLFSVILGAFGAHFLKQHFPDNIVNTFETAVRYQFYHSFALLINGILYKEFPNNEIRRAGRNFIGGIILFCGSLYLLIIINLNHNIHFNWIGSITPVGGVLFIAGWLKLFLGLKKEKNKI